MTLGPSPVRKWHGHSSSPGLSALETPRSSLVPSPAGLAGHLLVHLIAGTPTREPKCSMWDQYNQYWRSLGQEVAWKQKSLHWVPGLGHTYQIHFLCCKIIFQCCSLIWSWFVWNSKPWCKVYLNHQGWEWIWWMEKRTKFLNVIYSSHCVLKEN